MAGVVTVTGTMTTFDNAPREQGQTYTRSFDRFDADAASNVTNVTPGGATDPLGGPHGFYGEIIQFVQQVSALYQTAGTQTLTTFTPRSIMATMRDTLDDLLSESPRAG